MCIELKTNRAVKEFVACSGCIATQLVCNCSDNVTTFVLGFDVVATYMYITELGQLLWQRSDEDLRISIPDDVAKPCSSSL